ncbi:MAG TPA: murein biosynthesis integral membrane protein MurJ, partial [Burkholderiaceae bacterium]|nr:murein biosynthesis integral membrane protein MurJ [Burkholderiaceae bacterium]
MNLLRSAATVSGFTLLSRITGLVRENLTATIFGASALTDAFFVAFRLPNLLRRMFAEGAFSQAFVPILAAVREGGDDASMHRLVDHVATVLFWALVAVSALGVVAAPALVWAMASGLRDAPGAFEAGVVMTRWMFPYILLISLVALAAGVLNTWRQFAVPAFTPVLLNLAFIGAALVLAPRFDPPVYALAAGVVAGGVAQLALQVPALLRIGMLPRIGFDPRVALADPQVRRIVRQMGPAVLAVSVAQISLIVNTHIASRIGPGAVSWVSFGDRLMEFPTALLGVALGTVLLPSLARANAAGRADEYASLLDWGLRLAALLALPCMVGLALMAEPLTALLFHYGRFDDQDLQMTARAVLAYGAGLLGLIAVKILAPGFYGRQDVRTPFRIALVVLAVTQALNLALVPAFGHAGLALSISVAATVNAGLLLAGLVRRGIYRPAPGWGAFAAKLAVALAALAVLLAFTVPRFDWAAMEAEPVLRAALVLGLVGTGALLYLGVLAALSERRRLEVQRP